jgi:hypothetical protein
MLWRLSLKIVVFAVSVFNSRKHGKKELQSFVDSGSFDHHDLQSLNNYRIFFL